MKKYIIFSFLMLSSPVMAGFSDYACLHLEITIKNNTQNTCYLIEHEAQSGFIYSEKHDLAFKILPGEESSVLDLINGLSSGPNIDLQYECGEGRYITLHTEKNMCGNDNTTTAFLLSAANLSANPETTPASYWSNKPATVHWTIY
ncbi:MAG: hypothetical protein CK424_02045 [Legionella sp.]|nr:MAG: hypothetical protein CK424_02045 [Legionella sp.]